MSNGPITLTAKGDFSKANKFLERCLNIAKLGTLDKYGKMGVEALSQATPVDTGLAASSWSYEINRSNTGFTIEWHNTDIENGYNVIMGIQYGHGTKSGGWVEGVDFINPTIKPIFEQIKEDLIKEVTTD